MSKLHKPRGGSLQFYPRVRAEKILPSVNWNSLQEEGKGILGFVGYKVGMLSAVAKDSTPNSMTKGKQIILPITIIECPIVKIFSVRFYKNKQIKTEVVVSNDILLKKIIRVPKQIKKENLEKEEKNLSLYDDLRILCYTISRIKKTPDIFELGIAGTIHEKFSGIKQIINKDIGVQEIFSPGQLVDIHAVTKGKGIQGPIKRFGISKKQHKTEKGVRKPGTLGAWTPKRVSFRAPQMGQMGFFSRVQYNNQIIELSNIREKDITPKGGFPHFGLLHGDYIIVKGSVQGVQKRPIMLTVPARPGKKPLKQNYEIVKVI